MAALVLLALMVPLLIAAWIWLFPDRQPTPLLVLSVPHYDSPAPPNAFAAEDAARFQDAYARYANVRPTIAGSPRSSADLIDALTAYLDRTPPGGPEKNIALIFLSAHGVVNDHGQPCLLLPDHAALDSSTWLPFTEVLKAVAQRKQPDERKIVLLLDAARIDDAWSMGIVANAFSLALEELLNESLPKNCVVLSASSGLNPAVAAPEISGTPFGYYAARGLRGDADREGNRDAVVTLHELRDYLASHVAAWTAEHRGVVQRPKLFGGEIDLELADVAGRGDFAVKPWKPPIDPGDFQKLLDQLEIVERSQVYRHHPLAWAQVQSLLERLDAESLAGSAYAADARDVSLRNLEHELNQLQGAPVWPWDDRPMTLAMYEKTTSAPEALDAIWGEWQKDPAKTKVSAGYAAVAEFIWDKLCGADSEAEASLVQALEFCRAAGAPSGYEFPEIAFVQLLANYTDWKSPALSAGIPGSLLKARRQSELLAAGDDPRQHYVIGPRLRELDQSLALALDQVIVGSNESLPLARQRTAALVGEGPDGYRPVRDLSELVSNSLTARDQALASALHFNQWTVRRARSNAAYRTPLGLQPLVNNALELAQVLDRVVAQPPASDQNAEAERLRTLASGVQASTLRTRDEYARRVAEISIEEAGSPMVTAVETPSLLRCPLGFDKERRRLHEQWFEKLTSAAGDGKTPPRNSKGAGAPDDAEKTPSASRDEDAFLRWLAIDGAAPLRTILEDDSLQLNGEQGEAPSATGPIDEKSSRAEIIANLAALGGSIRQRLTAAGADCEQWKELSKSLLDDRPASEARAGLSKADVLSRSLAPIAGSALRFDVGESPADELRKIDSHAWLVWQGNRLLDDCWGMVDGENSTAEPYFQMAARNLADRARRFSPDPRYETTQLLERLAMLEQLMRQWQPLSAKDLPLPEEGGAVLRHQVDFKGDDQLRPGQAAFFLTDDDGQLFQSLGSSRADVRRVGVDVHQSPELANDLRPDSLRDVSGLEANVIFRGHVKHKRFSIGHGVFVEWKKPPAAAASVVVRGDSKQLTQIILIVDCSISMLETNDNIVTRDKLKEGLEVVKHALDQLTSEDRFRVGVIFYGRRAGWRGKNPDSKLVHDTDFDFTGEPSDDVYAAMHLTRLRKENIEDVKALLDTAKPYGVTPLYLALISALNEFDWNSEGPRHLIALTDGVNWIDEDRPIQNNPTPKNVIDKFREHAGGVKLDVIEFAGSAPPEQEERWEKGRKELDRIMNSITPRGAFHPVQDAAGLTQELEDSLHVDRYQLRSVDREPGAAVDTEWTNLGEPTPLGEPASPKEFQVFLKSHKTVSPAQIRIEGGEALEIEYRPPPDSRLLFPVFQGRDRREERAVRDFLVASYLPNMDSADPVFRVSIQSGDEKRFSLRPEVIYAKVSPAEDGGKRAYYFFDPLFEARQRAPMLMLAARNWPGAETANVELCFAMRADALPAATFQVPPLDPDVFEAGGATLQVKSEIVGDSYQVSIIEQHPPTSKTYPLHLTLDPPPDSVGRTYFENDHSVNHVFRYSKRANPTLRVLTRQDIAAGGVEVVFKDVELPR